jgi:SAM-dependent methyltransferase
VTEIRDYYRTSSDYRRMLAAQDPRIFDPYVELFRACVPPGAPVIDVGCGVGDSTLLLRREGFAAAGADLSECFLPAGEEGFVVADFESASDIADGSFAAAGALNVLEHSERPRRLLAEMLRVVGPGGHVIVLSPNLTSPLVGLRILLDHMQGAPPYLGISRSREALALVAVNVVRTLVAACGRDAFRRRAPRLGTAVPGGDADAVYWTNAAEVRRLLESQGCRIRIYQGAGRTRASRLLARWLPVCAGTLRVVAQKPAGAPPSR